MTKTKKLNLIRETGIIAIMRAQRSDQLLAAAEAIRLGGVSVIEVTMTTPDALGVIESAATRFGREVLFGAGSVLDAKMARSAILSGAGFIVAPTLDLEVIKVCQRCSVPVIPGCFSSTEMLTAWQAGAEMVKLFPASLGGPGMLKAILAPLPQLEIVPVGGVNLTNAAEFIRKGAAALGVGSNLINQQLLDEGDMDALTGRAAAFIAAIKEGRGGQAA
jgi:2-dehydro-3-deoxyphosphogluconate aldolase/(4S)-4-hydroxy-2-oxoglutarate aldolase